MGFKEPKLDIREIFPGQRNVSIQSENGNFPGPEKCLYPIWEWGRHFGHFETNNKETKKRINSKWNEYVPNNCQVWNRMHNIMLFLDVFQWLSLLAGSHMSCLYTFIYLYIREYLFIFTLEINVFLWHFNNW